LIHLTHLWFFYGITSQPNNEISSIAFHATRCRRACLWGCVRTGNSRPLVAN
jgi:hypothetical protein